MRLGILVPTRNRPDIALRAVRSALDSGIADFVVVSDNSTDDARREELETGYRAIDDDRLRAVAPPTPMAMPRHWEWAMQRLLDEDPELTHVTVLTDRMVYQPGAPEALRRVVAATPDKVVSWGHDTVDDYDRPVRLYQEPWSGRRLLIPTSWIIDAASHGRVVFAPLPRLLNSIAPVDLVRRVGERFGTVFDSVAPDFCFAYRTIATVDDIVYYDRSCVIQTDLNRSNGMNVSRRGDAADVRDFRANLPGSVMSPDAPIHGIESLYNGIVNEYCFVRAEVPDAFPPIDPVPYMDHLAGEVAAKPDPGERAHDEALLRAAGWTGTLDAPRTATVRDRIRLDRSCVGAYPTSLAKGIVRTVLGHHLTKPVWKALGLVGVHPYLAQRFHFRDRDEALAYALAHPRPPWHDHPHVVGLSGHPELEPSFA